MLAFSNDYYGFIFRVTQSVELFCTYGKSISIFLNKQKEVVRRVFLLKYFYFESNIAIAERCGFTERKVTHMLAHTRAQLKEYLIKEEIYL